MRGLDSNPQVGWRKVAIGRAAPSVRLALLVLAIWILGVTPAAAAQALSLAPDAGQPGSAIDALHSYTPPPRSSCPTGSTVDFWWDAAGAGATNPAGARLLGQAVLEGSGCTARARLTVPATSSCAVHTVYAFIDSGRGGPVSGTISSSRFTVTGCPSPKPSPKPTPKPTPKPPPRASASPTAKVTPAPAAATPVSPAASVATSPSASVAASPTPVPSSSPQLLVLPAPSGGPSTPPLGAAPTVPPNGPGVGPLVIVALIGGAALLVAWVRLYFTRLKPRGASPFLKWGSFVLVLVLTGGGVGLAVQKEGTILNLNVPNWQFPTIQSALDAAPVGANVHIKPGTYHETLFVRKPLQIYASEDDGGVVLAGPLVGAGDLPSEPRGLINYEGAGGGWLFNVRLEGGGAGVLGLGTADLQIDDIEISGSDVGLLWDSAATLTAKHVTIHGTEADGFVNLEGHPSFGEFGIDFVGGIGIYIANGNANLSDVDIEDNDSVGIYIRDAGVTINGGVIANNNVAGIWAVNSSIVVGPMYIYSNHPDPMSDRFGDGVAVLLGDAELKAFQSSYNDRCGITAFGATISLTTTLYQDNLFQVCGEALSPSALSPGLPASDADFNYEDLGGNTCWSEGVEHVCQITSPGLEPPEPIPPSP